MKKTLSNSSRSLLAALIANAIFGFSFLLTRVALSYATPYVLLACRFFVAVIVFTLIMLFTKIKISLKGKPWVMLLLLGIFQPVLYFLGETYGVLYTSSTFSAIMIALIPIVSLMASAFFLRESPTWKQSLFCFLSVFGVVLITVNTNTGSNKLLGVLLLLLAVCSNVAFHLTSRKISTAFTAFERTYMMMVMGFVVFFSLMLRETGGQLTPFLQAFRTPNLRWPILYLGIFSSVIAFFFLNFANTHLPVTRTIVFTNVTTLVTVFAGVLFLGEVLSPLAFFSTGLIVIGVWGVQRFARIGLGPEPASKEDL